MIGAFVLRGLCAGLLAGLLAALFALVCAEPSIEAAIAIEEAQASESPAPAGHDHGSMSDGHAHSHGDGAGIARGTQRIGLVVGLGLYGLALGAAFGLVSAWARGRLAGDAWTRALKLGAAAIAVLVLLPAITYPPNPPAVGDPDTVGMRTVLYLGTWALGLLLIAIAWNATRALAARAWSPPTAQALVGAGTALATGLVIAVLPEIPGPSDFPADLLWSFRLQAIATQTILFVALAVLFGLLSAHTEPARVPYRSPR